MLNKLTSFIGYSFFPEIAFVVQSPQNITINHGQARPGSGHYLNWLKFLQEIIVLSRIQMGPHNIGL